MPHVNHIRGTTLTSLAQVMGKLQERNEITFLSQFVKLSLLFSLCLYFLSHCLRSPWASDIFLLPPAFQDLPSPKSFPLPLCQPSAVSAGTCLHMQPSYSNQFSTTPGVAIVMKTIHSADSLRRTSPCSKSSFGPNSLFARQLSCRCQLGAGRALVMG